MEMERRLWLGDKWFYQLQLGKVQQSEVFQQAVKSLGIFFDYRENYFGMKAGDEKLFSPGISPRIIARASKRSSKNTRNGGRSIRGMRINL